jgi:hypothetical protein
MAALARLALCSTHHEAAQTAQGAFEPGAERGLHRYRSRMVVSRMKADGEKVQGLRRSSIILGRQGLDMIY